MKRLIASLFWIAAFLCPLQAAVVQITVKDSAGVVRSFNVTTNTDLTGNLNWQNIICDQAAGTTCASVGTAGSPSTNALTVQPVTIGNGTSANAGRVTLSNDGTGVLATVSTVTTLSTLTGGGAASGAADSGNPVKIGGKYNATPISLTDGNRGDYQMSLSGAGRVMAGANWGAITTWTTGTTVNTNLVLMCGDGAQSITVDLQDTGTIGGGQISFQFSNDATDCSGTTGTWFNFPVTSIVDQYTLAAAAANPWIAAGGQTKFTIYPNGTRAVRARLTTVLTGAGHQVIVSPTVVPASTAITGILSPIAGITPVKFDQTTTGTTNGIAIVGVNGATALAGNGVSGTGSLRVNVASDNTAFAVNSTLSAETTKVIGTVRNVGNVGGVYDAVSGAAVPANLLYNGVNVGGNLTPIVGDPCQTVAKSYTPISITTATTTRIIAPAASKKTYVCYMLLTSAAADNVGIVEGTGGTCGTGTAGVIGGTTAANGPNFSANGGVSFGNGGYAAVATTGTNVDFCLITSAATPLSGHVSWVQQ